ncbi:phosphotransacetylase [Sulfurimonas denitrificans DSM 1251]|uniref:Phosphate acetyltransferase n=1 Tax=Sulfurimonas denitrificans (strain ATCC 33889 / DSM 1251) TaxID=326298 RepID=Q30UJ5_SULDN|nr:phosphate acetyltransferase [Sulfurimonas denitrificans]ABB43336.1 phosphotransacetylase [Sulfurimonas denitrificans DSM 1251]MDD3442312.1 phosphate acetyltransferase [Sulfurimonas denitrificans]
MNVQSLYILALEKNVGSLFITMGIMEILKRNINKVAFFRPIITDKNVVDKDIEFISQRYNLEMSYEECYGFDLSEVDAIIASSGVDELIMRVVEKFKKLQERYEFILCEGIARSLFTSNSNHNLNALLAQNFGSSIITIFSAKEHSPLEVYESIAIEKQNLLSLDIPCFNMFVSRVDEQSYLDLKRVLKDYSSNISFLKELPELDVLTLEDVVETLDVKKIVFSQNDNARAVRGFFVASLGVDEFLDEIKDDDLVIVDAKRSDIILALIASFYSKEYPKISAALFVGDSELTQSLKKLILGLHEYKIPFLSIKSNTFESVKKLLHVYPRLRVKSERKIALALGLFSASVDITAFEQKIKVQNSDVMTPIMFQYKLFEMARKKKKNIVLPESSDERILRAAEIVLRRDVADITLLGKEEEIREHCQKLGLDISKATIIDHKKSKRLEEFSNLFYEMRKAKGITLKAARDAMMHRNYFATMMVHVGLADGMVSGAIHSTADTLRPALQIIKTTSDVEIVSSIFFMCLKTKILIYGDCALNQNPNAKELAQIAISSAKTAELFDITPKVAMLSYSTGESGSGADVDKVREATMIVKALRSDLEIDGPLQYDAAVDKSVASMKLPNSKVAGEANVFIFPDLNTGNNTYKAVERSSGALAIGPILQGLKKPVNDLSRGCSEADVLNTILITAIQANM